MLTVGGRYADEPHSDRAVWLLQITRIDADDPQAGLVCALIETFAAAAHRALIGPRSYALAVEAAGRALGMAAGRDALFCPRACARCSAAATQGDRPAAELRERIDPADRLRYDEALAAHLSGRTPAVQIELCMRRDDGTRLWVELHALARRATAPARHARRRLDLATSPTGGALRRRCATAREGPEPHFRARADRHGGGSISKAASSASTASWR